MREPRRVPVSAAIRLHTTSFGSLVATVVVGATGADAAGAAVAAGDVIAGVAAEAGEAVAAGVAGMFAASVSAAIEDEAAKATTAAAAIANAKLRKTNPLYCSGLPTGDQITRMTVIVQVQSRLHK